MTGLDGKYAFRAELSERVIADLVGPADGPEEVLDDPPPDQAGLVGHASWMFVADLFAGLVPVIPFFFLPVEAARWWAIIVTVVLMVALGIGRSRVGKTPLISTVASTLGIAAAAGVVGVAIGWGLDSLV